jgi:hypothetical protein
MKILIGCEESQVLCKTFRQASFDAYSCDIIPTRGDNKYHYQEDIFDCIKRSKWALIVLHPPCTALCLSGNRWYGKGMPKHNKRKEALLWTLSLWQLAKQYSNHIALENPKSVLFKRLPIVQYIQPWQFGHPENKTTGFALYNLPQLKPTKIVPAIENRIHNMPPSKNRSRDRSITYQGIADAIVNQWGNYIKD